MTNIKIFFEIIIILLVIGFVWFDINNGGNNLKPI